MKVGIIIVTYNRLEKLKSTLDKFNKQTVKPKYILVIDNNSNDGTKEYLEKWEKDKKEYKKYNKRMDDNLGGSGGFYEGLKQSLNLDADWIWVSDDDAFPEIDTIKNAEEFLNNYKDKENLSAFCSKVCNNGKIDYCHRNTIKKGLLKIKSKKSKEEDYKKEYFEINQFSYVGSIISKKALEKVGLTEKNYFIYYDDSEHAYRLSKIGKILCVPNIVVNHNIINSNFSDWKLYYHIRNKLLFYKTVGERYFYYEYMKTKMALCIKKVLKYNTYKHKLINDALDDAKNNKMGKHKIYVPGWKFNIEEK